MKGKRFVILLSAICLMLATKPTTQSAAKTIEIKLATGLAAGHYGNYAAKAWAKELGERSKGSVKVTTYFGTMGKPPEFYDMVKNGVVDMMDFGQGWAPGRFPVLDVTGLPFEVPTPALASAVSDALYANGLLDKELAPFKLLFFKSVGSLCLFTKKKKVTKMEDFRGLKIRPIPGKIPKQTIEALGATSVYVRGAETYMAIDRGTLDGAVTGPDNAVSRKYYEVCKYGCTLPITGGIWFMFMNKGTWNSLPTDIKLIIEQINKKVYSLYHADKLRADKESWALLNNKIEIYDLDPAEAARWREATAPIIDEWVKSMEDKGMPGQEILDITRDVIKQYSGTQYYSVK